jgi:hypothetical protein
VPAGVGWSSFNVGVRIPFLITPHEGHDKGRPTDDCVDVRVPGVSNAQRFLMAATSAFSQQLASTRMLGARTAPPDFGH